MNTNTESKTFKVKVLGDTLREIKKKYFKDGDILLIENCFSQFSGYEGMYIVKEINGIKPSKNCLTVRDYEIEFL